MEEVTFVLALVLGGGLLVARIARLFGLPAVTGYICAGMALGPGGLGLLSREVIEGRLGHFTQIALMLIAFGIGEHLELKKLRHTARSVGLIAMSEGFSAFLLTAAGTFVVLSLTVASGAGWGIADCGAVALLLGSVAIATAPASTLMVLREAGAAGPLTTTLLQVVAINNGMAIMIFGLSSSVLSHLLTGGAGAAPLAASLLACFTEISASLLMGLATGLLIDWVVARLEQGSEMLIAGLALLLLCGEAARMLDYSPLLAGMGAGMAMVNRDRRDVRLFRILNSFDPPIQLLFFALAGAHLDLGSLIAAGWVGVCYFVCRGLGKYLGANLGSRLTSVSRAVRDYIGLALLPQAGIAIGLIFLVREYPGLDKYSSLITTVVLAGVFLAELTGPACTRYAVIRAGEAVAPLRPPESRLRKAAGRQELIQLVPWIWEKLELTPNPQGVVLFGAAHAMTVRPLARMATIFANHFGARPLAVRIMRSENSGDSLARLSETRSLFKEARAEALSMGCRLETAMVKADDIAAGLLAAARQNKARVILLGHPHGASEPAFQRVVERVALAAPCPVVVIRFAGVLHTERILVPLVGSEELTALRDVILSLAVVGRHTVTILYLMPPEATAAERAEKQQKVLDWMEREESCHEVRCRVRTTENRLEAVIEEAMEHDLVVVNAGSAQGLKRFFFGSLAESIVQHCGRTVLMVHDVRESRKV